MEIKNIIFDLGGVILNIDPQKSIEAMKKLGFIKFEESYTLAKQNDLFDNLEKGFITDADFRLKIKENLPKEVSDKQINEAWGMMLLNFPQERIELLKKLKAKYRIFLLSNTNLIHYKIYDKEIYRNYSIHLSDLFEKAYYSHEIGMRKPDTNFFNHVLSKSKLQAKETLFIDDSLLNIESANSLGINTIHLDLSKNQNMNTALRSFI
ncbi:MAG: HAD family phosphatase [Bacteroidota bacterium]|nr:HAD family phosphatase [Bacteroidota bacterium]